MKSKKLARREFLAISSKAVLVTAAGTLISPKTIFAAAAGAGFDPLLSIGYAPSLPDEGRVAALASADRILTPDPGFISRGARVTILGSSRAPGRKNAPGSLFLDALFPSQSGAENENRRFRFWSMNGRADADTISGNLSFRIPVLATTGIAFVARFRRPGSNAPADAPGLPAVEDDTTAFTLSLGRAAGPHLQRGVYVLALREPGDSANAPWDRLRLSNDGTHVAVADAAFSYVILQIDYDDERRPGKRRAA